MLKINTQNFISFPISSVTILFIEEHTEGRCVIEKKKSGLKQSDFAKTFTH